MYLREHDEGDDGSQSTDKGQGPPVCQSPHVALQHDTHIQEYPSDWAETAIIQEFVELLNQLFFNTGKP